MIRKLMPFVVFETNDVAAATPPAPVEAAPAPPQPAPVGDGPWAQDIRSTFQDPEVQRQVDAFLRSKVQPHVTQVEQQYAPARELWQDLQAEDQSQSLGTYLAIAEQLYGPEVAQAVASSLEAQFTQPQQPETPAPAQPQLTPEQQQAIDWANAQQAEQLYQSELARVKASDPNVRDELFHPFVVGSEGDFDQALAAYQNWHAQAYPAAPAEPAPEPPATLTGEGAPAAIPPTEPARQTLDSALEDTLAEMRANRGAPTTVGQV
ncbi:MAG: hypothetical protein ACXVGB_00655 [Mycobacteriaceae bacterium]